MRNPTAYEGIPNSFRKHILARDKVIGCWCALGSPITTEVLGEAGFDWLLLDGEHAPNDVLSFIPQLMALKDSSSAPVVRPNWNNKVEIKRLLDIGFYNFLVPYVQSAEEARAAVEATRYPPKGIRGVSVAHRSNHYGEVPDYMKLVNDNITVLVQIESRKALEAVEEIAAVDGVDGIFVGPSDLSHNLGHPGNPRDPDVQKAIQHVFDVAKKHNKSAGILAPKEEDARRYLEMGANFVAVGSDLGVYHSATKALCKKYKNA